MGFNGAPFSAASDELTLEEELTSDADVDDRATDDVTGLAAFGSVPDSLQSAAGLSHIEANVVGAVADAGGCAVACDVAGCEVTADAPHPANKAASAANKAIALTRILRTVSPFAQRCKLQMVAVWNRFSTLTPYGYRPGRSALDAVGRHIKVL